MEVKRTMVIWVGERTIVRTIKYLVEVCCVLLEGSVFVFVRKLLLDEYILYIEKSIFYPVLYLLFYSRPPYIVCWCFCIPVGII